MKRFALALLLLLVVVTLGGFIVYKFYLPTLIAKTVVANDLPTLVPSTIKTKIDKARKPINEGASTVISTIHQSGVSIEQIFKAIDEAKEEQAYAMLDELNLTQITNVDQVFDMGKKYFPVDFDVEIFREAYRKKATLPLIEKALAYANKYRNEKLMDAQTAKETAKRILKEKEAEFNKVVKKSTR